MELPVVAAKKKQAGMLRCQTPEGDLGRPGALRASAQQYGFSHTAEHLRKSRGSAKTAAKAAEGRANRVRLAVELRKT
jgi:hypothetical protein